MDSSWTTAVNRILTTIAVVLALSTGAAAEMLYSRHGLVEGRLRYTPDWRGGVSGVDYLHRWNFPWHGRQI